MPIYEYRCKNCGKMFEIFQKIGDEPLKTCRICNGTLHKLISQCSFHLKGTGWYVTDYKKPIDSVGHGGNGGKHAVKEEEKTEAKAEVKTETKTEAKKEGTAHTGGQDEKRG